MTPTLDAALLCKLLSLKLVQFFCAKVPVSVQTVSWLLNKKSPKLLKEMINMRLMWLHATALHDTSLKSEVPDELGIFSPKLLEEDCLWPNFTAKRCAETGYTGPTPLSMDQLSNVFIGLMVGQAISIVALIAECILAKLNL